MNLQNDPRLKNMHPLKREILLRLSNSQSTMTPEQMLPQLMEINKELQKRCFRKYAKVITTRIWKLLIKIKENLTQPCSHS